MLNLALWKNRFAKQQLDEAFKQLASWAFVAFLAARTLIFCKLVLKKLCWCFHEYLGWFYHIPFWFWYQCWLCHSAKLFQFSLLNIRIFLQFVLLFSLGLKAFGIIQNIGECLKIFYKIQKTFIISLPCQTFWICNYANIEITFTWHQWQWRMWWRIEICCKTRSPGTIHNSTFLSFVIFHIWKDVWFHWEAHFGNCEMLTFVAASARQ